jgi:glycosyltransferase involved in cell wall biosynthesis
MQTNFPLRGRPVVSIVTPTYNQADFLSETIESVLAQDYPYLEYRVIDDGSTDTTREILASYDGRIMWESHANQGQTPTINKGWKLAQGDILTWLNSDDSLLPGAVTKAVNYFNDHPDTGIVFGDTLFTQADGTPIERSRPLPPFDYLKFVMSCENPIAQPSAFIRREVVEAVGLLDSFYYYFMDWDFWLRAGLQCRIDYIPELLSTYRLHAESKTVSQALKAAPELERMYKAFFARPDLPTALQDVKAKAMANMYFTSGGYYLKGGGKKGAVRMAFKALTTYPAVLFGPTDLHKFLYCLFGESAIYKSARAHFHQRRATTPQA